MPAVRFKYLFKPCPLSLRQIKVHIDLRIPYPGAVILSGAVISISDLNRNTFVISAGIL